MTESPERDEFDEIAGRGGPVGVHRAPRPWYTRVVAPLLVFLLAGAAAFLIAQYLWSRDIAEEPDPTPTVTTSVTSSPSTSPSQSASTSTTPTPSETATVTIEYDTPIAVLNGAGITGLASTNQGLLEDAGFTKVTAGNLTGTRPDANVVVFTSEELRDTAAEVAKTLGIDGIALDVATTDADIEVHLVSDPAA